MTDSSHGGAFAGDEATERLRVIAAELSAAGLAIHLHPTRAGLDLTATPDEPGRRETEIIVDDDGYIELRYWADPEATPVQVAGTIIRALAAVAANLGERMQSGQAQHANSAPRFAVATPDRYAGYHRLR